MPREITYILYDRKTGAPLASHTYVGIEGDSSQESLTRAKRDFRTHVEGASGRGVDVIEVKLPEGSAPHQFRIDPKTKRRVAKSKLNLQAKKTTLIGNGEDSAMIEISAVDRRGRVSSGATGTIHVSTTRGRLSARGGDVELQRGVAQIELTSVAETIDSVVLTASDPAGLLLPGSIELEFV